MAWGIASRPPQARQPLVRGRPTKRAGAASSMAIIVALTASHCRTVDIRFGRAQADAEAPNTVCRDSDCRDAATSSVPLADASGGLVASDAATTSSGCPAFPLGCTAPTAKCTLVALEQGAGYRSQCVRDDGDVAIGESCSLQAPAQDDCDISGFCSDLGIVASEQPERVCRSLCNSNGGCAADERCLNLAGGHFGLCMSACDWFAGDCPGGTRCVPGRDASGAYFGYCEGFGNQDEGQACSQHTDCSSAFVCELNSHTCRAGCDQAHVCPDGQSCKALEIGDLNSPRLCSPADSSGK